MKKTRVYGYEIVEGEHKGHHVVTDAYGIDFYGRDSETAAYCLDCHEPLDLYEVSDESQLNR